MNPHKLTQLPDGSMMDLDTGEIFDGAPKNGKGTFIFVPRRPKLTGWFMAFQDSFEELAKDRELWGQPMAILCYLFSKLDFENDIAIQQADIAKALEIDKHQTSKAMKKLVDKGVIIKGPKIGRASAYKLNINYGWKGKVVNFKKEQKKRAFDVVAGGAKNQGPA